jgi:hypothetical protein
MKYKVVNIYFGQTDIPTQMMPVSVETVTQSFLFNLIDTQNYLLWKFG